MRLNRTKIAQKARNGIITKILKIINKEIKDSEENKNYIGLSLRDNKHMCNIKKEIIDLKKWAGQNGK